MSWKRNPRQEELADLRRRVFREDLIFALARNGWKLNVSDDEIAGLTRNPVRTSQRYLKFWVDKGLFTVDNVRHKMNTGWVNRRFVSIKDSDIQLAFELQIRKFGRIY